MPMFWSFPVYRDYGRWHAQMFPALSMLVKYLSGLPDPVYVPQFYEGG